MKKNKKRGFGKFLLGAAVGTGLGMLFAPKKVFESYNTNSPVLKK